MPNSNDPTSLHRDALGSAASDVSDTSRASSTPKASAIPVPVLFKDEPTELDTDEFGHSSYTAVLVELLEHTSQPATIGLLGPWGVGKSSVLARTSRELRKNGAAVVTFDAWRYDDTALRRQLLRDVADGLQRIGAVDKRKFNVTKRFRRLDADEQFTTSRTRPTVGAAGVVLLQAGVIGLSIYAAYRLGLFEKTFANLEVKNGIVLSLVVAALTLVATLVGQIFRPVPYVRTHRRIEDPDVFYDLFRDLVAATKIERLVIAIDNLDRCRADDALDLLSTIKTYLEPAAKVARRDDTDGRTEVLFVIAVDEDALRRHLSVDGDLGADASEFLRKLFTASIRFAPLLDDDLRDYISTKVGAVRVPLGLDESQERRLVVLLDSAFHENPRQVLQFLNSLQLRVRLIREREAGSDPQISGEVSADVIAVAKLALIEDRWPLHYARLKRSPHLLDEWHARARLPGNDSADISSAEWSRLAPFLVVSAGIEIGDIAPLLTLKQSREELGLPEFGRFRVAARLAHLDAISGILDAHPAYTAEYAARAHRALRHELRTENYETARAMMHVALSEPRIAGGDPAAESLFEALEHPNIEQHLRLLPLSPLIGEAAKLSSKEKWGRVIGIAIAELANSSQARRIEASEAVAAISDQLSHSHRQSIAGQLSAETLGRTWKALAALAQAEPPLVPESALMAFTTAVQQSAGILIDPEVGNACRGIMRYALADPSDELARPVGLALEAAAQHFTETESSIGLMTVRDLVRNAPMRAEFVPTQRRLRESLQMLPAAEQPETVEWLWSRSELPDAADEAAALAEREVLIGGANQLPSLEQRVGNFPSPVRDRIANRLVTIAETATTSNEWSIAYVVAASRLTTNADQLVSRFAQSWINGLENEPNKLADVLRAVQLSADVSQGIAALAAQRGGVLPPRNDAAHWFALALELGMPLDALKPAVDPLPGIFVNAGEDFPSAETVAAAVQVANAVELTDDDFARMVEPVLVHLLATERFGGVLDELLPSQGKLNVNQRVTLRMAALDRWRFDPAEKSAWARRIQALNYVASDHEKESFAVQVVGVSRTAGQELDRRELLSLVIDGLGLSQILVMHVLELKGSQDVRDQAFARDFLADLAPQGALPHAWPPLADSDVALLGALSNSSDGRASTNSREGALWAGGFLKETTDGFVTLTSAGAQLAKTVVKGDSG